jgi:hypothetical protein
VPVGNDGETLVADSSTSTGLSYQANFAAGKNRLINGNFAINQRSFSSTTTSGTFGFDRWFLAYSGGTGTYSKQSFTPGTAPVSGYEGEFFARIVTASQSAAGDYATLQQKIEDVRTFAGQTITYSFWAKASTGTPNVGITLVQNFGGGGSGGVVTSPAVKAITTSWARYSFTVAVPSVSGKTIGVSSALESIIFTSNGATLQASGYAAVGVQNATIDIWGVQAEAGSTATAFQTATGTIQGELAACQRYYYAMTSNATGGYSSFGVGAYYSTTNCYVTLWMPVEMRTQPTYSGSGTTVILDAGTIRSATGSSLDQTTNRRVVIYVTTAATTAGRAAWWASDNNTTAVLTFSSEL